MRVTTRSPLMKRLLIVVVAVAALLLSLAVAPVFGGGDNGLEKADQARQKHTDELLAKDGVVGVALGRDQAGRGAVLVLTAEPGVAGIPNELDGVPVRVRVTGEIFALAPPPAEASFTFSCSGLTCEFDGSGSTGRKLSFAWLFGDGGTGTGKIVNHTYAETGTFSVTLTVTDKDGIEASDTQSVEVTDAAPPPPPPGGNNCFESDETTVRCDRPVPMGVSTGHPSITAGTIGVRVTDGTDFWALSNNHVYAATNCATPCSIGDNVLQPGNFDGGTDPADAIGTLADFQTILFDGSDNIMDAAIALTDINTVGNATPNDGYGTPSSTTQVATVGLRVIKYGRTTGETKGRVFAINATVNVNYGDPGVARFVDQDVVLGGDFSAGGDSGSFVVTRGEGHKGVGLLFAGSANATIFSPIDAILTRFGVTIDGTQ